MFPWVWKAELEELNPYMQFDNRHSDVWRDGYDWVYGRFGAEYLKGWSGEHLTAGIEEGSVGERGLEISPHRVDESVAPNVRQRYRDTGIRRLGQPRGDTIIFFYDITRAGEPAKHQGLLRSLVPPVDASVSNLGRFYELQAKGVTFSRGPEFREEDLLEFAKKHEGETFLLPNGAVIRLGFDLQRGTVVY
jgi:hypothetical protein